MVYIGEMYSLVEANKLPQAVAARTAYQLSRKPMLQVAALTDPVGFVSGYAQLVNGMTVLLTDIASRSDVVNTYMINDEEFVKEFVDESLAAMNDILGSQDLIDMSIGKIQKVNIAKEEVK